MQVSAKDIALLLQKKPKRKVNISQNMFQSIKWFNLGNLSANSKIPNFLIKFMLKYVIQISRALAHTHKHGLIHGNLCLSKVMVQKFFYKEGSASESISMSSLMDEDASQGVQCIPTFFLTNFEPWLVDELALNFKDDHSAFKGIMKMNNLKPTREDIVNILKIKDLQAFGNTIVDIMVGRCEETIVKPDARKESVMSNLFNIEGLSAEAMDASHETNELSQMKTGVSTFNSGISLDAIPLNWVKETKVIPNILKII